MSSTSKSKSYRRKLKFIVKPKLRWQVKQPKRNWLELPSDLMVNILQRLSVFNILENVQKVCTAWREICKDPAMWRRMNMDRFYDSRGKRVFREMCKHAVDRSQGQLLDLTMVGCCDFQLLHYVSDSIAVGKNLPGLTHLELIGNTMNNTGLKAILDGCCHLQSLDLRRCTCLDLNRDIVNRCSQQIKFLKLPNDSFEGCPHALYYEGVFDFGSARDDDYYLDYDNDDYLKYYYEAEFDEDMAFMYVFE